MSVIEDTRKLIQDFLAPELRSISARLDALEQRVDDRFRDLDAKISGQHQQTMLAIANLANYQAVLERVAKLESRTSQ
jgi:hypothetical protein